MPSKLLISSPVKEKVEDDKKTPKKGVEKKANESKKNK
jgi:hypothetical protein